MKTARRGGPFEELQIADCRLKSDAGAAYEARAVRRGAGAAARGAAFTTLARAAVRAFAVKQRSRAPSTRPSIAAADSRCTSDTSEMIRNFARSSIRFSRNG